MAQSATDLLQAKVKKERTFATKQLQNFLKNRKKHLDLISNRNKLDRKITSRVLNHLPPKARESFTGDEDDPVAEIDRLFHPSDPRSGLGSRLREKLIKVARDPELNIVDPDEALENLLIGEEKKVAPQLREVAKSLGGFFGPGEDDILIPEHLKPQKSFTQIEAENAAEPPLGHRTAGQIANKGLERAAQDVASPTGAATEAVVSGFIADRIIKKRGESGLISTVKSVAKQVGSRVAKRAGVTSIAGALAPLGPVGVAIGATLTGTLTFYELSELIAEHLAQEDPNLAAEDPEFVRETATVLALLPTVAAGAGIDEAAEAGSRFIKSAEAFQGAKKAQEAIAQTAKNQAEAEILYQEAIKKVEKHRKAMGENLEEVNKVARKHLDQAAQTEGILQQIHRGRSQRLLPPSRNQQQATSILGRAVRSSLNEDELLKVRGEIKARSDLTDIVRKTVRNQVTTGTRLKFQTNQQLAEQLRTIAIDPATKSSTVRRIVDTLSEGRRSVDDALEVTPANREQVIDLLDSLKAQPSARQVSNALNRKQAVRKPLSEKQIQKTQVQKSIKDARKELDEFNLEKVQPAQQKLAKQVKAKVEQRVKAPKNKPVSPETFKEDVRKGIKNRPTVPVKKVLPTAKVKAEIPKKTAESIQETKKKVKKIGINRVKKQLAQPVEVKTALTHGEDSAVKKYRNLITSDKLSDVDKARLNGELSSMIEKGIDPSDAYTTVVAQADELLRSGAGSVDGVARTVDEAVESGEDLRKLLDGMAEVENNKLFQEMSQKVLGKPLHEIDSLSDFKKIQDSVESLKSHRESLMRRFKGKGKLGIILGIPAALGALSEDAEALPLNRAGKEAIKFAADLFGTTPDDVQKLSNKVLKGQELKGPLELANEAQKKDFKEGLNLDRKTVESMNIRDQSFHENAIDVYGSSISRRLEENYGAGGVAAAHLLRKMNDETGFLSKELHTKIRLSLPPVTTAIKERGGKVARSVAGFTRTYGGSRAPGARRGFRTNLTKEEGKLVVDFLEGRLDETAKLPRYLAETAQGFRTVLDESFDMAKKEGLDVVGYRKNYFPRIIKSEFLNTQRGQKELMEFLVESKQADNLDDARLMVDRLMTEPDTHIISAAGQAGRRSKSVATAEVGQLRFSRRLELDPKFYYGGDGAHILEALTQYTNRISSAIGRSRAFGSQGQLITRLANRIESQFGKRVASNAKGEFDTGITISGKLASQQFIDLMNVATGRKHRVANYSIKPTDSKFFGLVSGENVKKVMGIGANIAAISLLHGSGIAQLGQLVHLSTKAGLINTMKGAVLGTFSKESRELIRQAAVVYDIDNTMRLAELGVGGKFHRVAELTLNAYGLLPADRMLRRWSAAASVPYIMETVKRLQKSGFTDDLAKNRFRELGISVDTVRRNIEAGKTPLSRNDMKRVMRRMSEATQFTAAPSELPMWFQSDSWRLVKLFKNFVVKSGEFINREIFHPAGLTKRFGKRIPKGQRDFMPLIRALTLAPVVGGVVQDAREGVQQEVGEAFGRSPSSISKIGKRRQELKRGKGFFAKSLKGVEIPGTDIHLLPHDLAAVDVALDNMSFAMAQGLFYETMLNLADSNYKWAFQTVAGPVASGVVETAAEFATDLRNQELKRTKENFKGLVPFRILKD